MAWDTKLITQLVAGRLDDLDALRQAIATKLGGTPTLNLRLEIALDDEKVIISVTDTDIEVRDDKRNRLIAAGDYEIARAAIKGYSTSGESPSDAEPEPAVEDDPASDTHTASPEAPASEETPPSDGQEPAAG